jgi:GAF domain-containing protein
MNSDEPMRVAPSREALATQMFVQLADTLVDDFDVIDLLTALAGRSIELLGAAAAGILLADDSQRLRVMAASSETVELLELFQVQNDEGACLDCYSSGEAIIVADLHLEPRWPLFGPECLRAGFPSVCALPLRIRSRTLGCLNLFMTEPFALSESDVALGQALADVCSITIVQDEANRSAALRELHLEHALHSRVLIEQAKGMIAERASLTMNDAFARLRTYARNNNLPLTETARDVVEGRLSIDVLSRPRPKS